MNFRTIVLTLLFIASAIFAVAMPECRVVSGAFGGPAIVIDGKPVSPLFFAANNQWGRDEVLLETLRRAAEAEIPLFSFNLALDWHSTAEESAAVVEKFCAAHPRGYFYVRIWLGPNTAWLDENPDARITLASGRTLDMASPSSTAWREEARRQLTERVRQIVEGPHGDRFIGVMPTYLNTGEWFYPETNDLADYSPVNAGAFRDWLREAYDGEDDLRKAWGQPGVTFDAVEPPTVEMRVATAWGPFRDPIRQRAAIDFARFQQETMADTIAYFARAVKEATNGKALVGVFYGYTMELNHNGPRALANSGHLALGRLLECDDLDMVHAPVSYFERALGQPGNFHLPIDSVALHGKLAVLEDDSFTHLSAEPDDKQLAPGWQHRTESLQETLDLVLRNLGNALGHRAGIWFFDLLSDGRWNDSGFWQQAGFFRRTAAEMRSQPTFRPEVAFITDERVIAQMADSTHPWLLESLANWRHEVSRMGTPVGYYLQSDLPRLPDSVKLVLLANAYQLSDVEKKALDTITARGGTVVYTYAAALLDRQGRVDLGHAGRELGFPLEARWNNEALMLEFENNLKQIQINSKDWTPRLIIAEDGDNLRVIGRFAGSGDRAVAAHPASSGQVIYSAVPRLSAEALREFAREANVHLYRDPAGMTAVAGNYLITHTADSDGGVRLHFRWPAPLSNLTRVAPPARFPLAAEAQQWDDTLPPRVTAIYRVTPAPVE